MKRYHLIQWFWKNLGYIFWNPTWLYIDRDRPDLGNILNLYKFEQWLPCTINNQWITIYALITCTFIAILCNVKTILNCYIDTETKYVCKNCLDMQFHYLSQLDLNLQNENRHSSFAKHVGAPRLLKFA